MSEDTERCRLPSVLSNLGARMIVKSQLGVGKIQLPPLTSGATAAWLASNAGITFKRAAGGLGLIDAATTAMQRRP